MIDRLRDLPSKKNFDSQFTVVRKNIKKRLIQRIKLDNNLYLSIDDYIPNLEELIKLEEDGQGNKYIKIFSTEGFGQLKSLFNKMRRWHIIFLLILLRLKKSVILIILRSMNILEG